MPTLVSIIFLFLYAILVLVPCFCATLYNTSPHLADGLQFASIAFMIIAIPATVGVRLWLLKSYNLTIVVIFILRIILCIVVIILPILYIMDGNKKKKQPREIEDYCLLLEKETMHVLTSQQKLYVIDKNKQIVNLKLNDYIIFVLYCDSANHQQPLVHKEDDLLYVYLNNINIENKDDDSKESKDEKNSK